MSALESLRVQRVAEIDPPAQSRAWLVRSLWASSAVGILGGPSKVWCAPSYVEWPRQSVETTALRLHRLHIIRRLPETLQEGQQVLLAPPTWRLLGLCGRVGLDRLALHFDVDPGVAPSRLAAGVTQCVFRRS